MNQALVDTFCRFVQIDSESGEEKAFLEFLAGLLAQSLGAECRFDAYGNLLARVPAKHCPRTEPVLFGCHGDTVKPGKGIRPVIAEGIIRSSGDTILGADDKAGIAELYEALRTSARRPEVEVVITREEELGLVGAKNLDTSGLRSKIGFLLDSDDINSIIIGGPSHMLIDVEVTGRAAHAGMEPEKGISAIKAAAHAISIIHQGRLDPESTVNVGIIEGGRIRNGVPEKCVVKAECRSLNHETCLHYSHVIKDVFESAARAIGATADVKLTLGYQAVRIPPDAPVVTLARRAIEKVGMTPDVRLITGGTDASILNQKGIQCVVLGIGARAEHSNDEHIALADMETVVSILHHLFEEMCV